MRLGGHLQEVVAYERSDNGGSKVFFISIW